MGKQFEFYSYKNDDEMIANTLRSVFGELLCVPRYKGDLSPFDICANDRLMYLTGKSFQQYISYYTHEYYDGTTAEVLDYVKSPVLEYRVPFQREDMAYIAGRFYCCSDNIEIQDIPVDNGHEVITVKAYLLKEFVDKAPARVGSKEEGEFKVE